MSVVANITISSRDPAHEATRTVAAVYGRHFNHLFELDLEWTTSHFRDFFPPHQSEPVIAMPRGVLSSRALLARKLESPRAGVRASTIRLICADGT